jgi:predicted AAA+ superfamily ATPase
MNKHIIKKIILENQERIPGLKVIKRQYRFDPEANYIITGQRRSGKTYLLYHLVQQMIRQGRLPGSILYLNFEDEACYTLKDYDTRKREISALQKASGKFAVARKLIVTWSDEEIIPDGSSDIRIIPAWKRLLEGEY